MYLRKNKVKCGGSSRTYLAVAHNLWCPATKTQRAQSRPVVVASLGTEDEVDGDLAFLLVDAIENCTLRAYPASESPIDAVRRAVDEIRPLEPFLRVLVSQDFAFGKHLPPGPDKSAILETLIREKLFGPVDSTAENALLRSVREAAVSDA